VLSAVDADPARPRSGLPARQRDAFETRRDRQVAGSSGLLLFCNLDADEAAEMSSA
jgi:hypothetical protein